MREVEDGSNPQLARRRHCVRAQFQPVVSMRPQLPSSHRQQGTSAPCASAQKHDLSVTSARRGEAVSQVDALQPPLWSIVPNNLSRARARALSLSQGLRSQERCRHALICCCAPRQAEPTEEVACMRAPAVLQQEISAVLGVARTLY
jgi:hypothetical protein